MTNYPNDFGLILEGRSDHAVVKQILASFFEGSSPYINGIVPEQDATDASLSTNPVGWGNVKAFLQSKKFLMNFQTTAVVVIQIDTDRSEDFDVPHNHPSEAREKTVGELVNDVIEKLIEWIRPENYALVKDRVIFAVAVLRK